MPSYVVTGASRGLGFGFIDKLSQDANNTVIGFVRDESKARKQVEEALGSRKNLHIVRGDLDDYESLQSAAKTVSDITGGSLDYLIANGGVSHSSPLSLTRLGKNPSELTTDLNSSFATNVTGNVHLINLLIPLVRASKTKKIVVLSTGLADLDLTTDYDVFESPTYSISKAAVNMMIAKYQAEFREEGILVMGISPGVVQTGNVDQAEYQTPEVQQKLGEFFGKFARYEPDFKGPITVEESVGLVMKVVDNATLKDNGGRVVSHLGTKRWL